MTDKPIELKIDQEFLNSQLSEFKAVMSVFQKAIDALEQQKAPIFELVQQFNLLFYLRDQIDLYSINQRNIILAGKLLTHPALTECRAVKSWHHPHAFHPLFDNPLDERRVDNYLSVMEKAFKQFISQKEESQEKSYDETSLH